MAVTTLAVAIAAFFLAENSGEALGAAALAGCAVAWTQIPVARAIAAHGRFLSLMRIAAPLAAPVAAFVILVGLASVDIFPLGVLATAALCAIGGVLTMGMLALPTTQKRDPIRVAVVGSPGTASDLQAELKAQHNRTFEVVGHIRWADAGSGGPERVEPLGAAGTLAETVMRERLDLLLVAPDIPRMSFFEEVEATCLHADVRILELATFYERVFGHIALRAINAAWFQWVMHPRYSPRIPAAKRAFDLGVAAAVAVVTLPLVAILAACIKLERAPAFYRQQRIGEGGRPFEILKLRTMRPADDRSPARWSSAGDERVTRLGRLLRRTHLDELPQIFNVLRGDMSLVGPRPEQPEFVERLESSVAFYSRRHTLRPGITGWAQVRCGYAGSHEGTLWKLSHDLYYLKHRSVTFDLLILGETLRTLVADSQFPSELYLPPFVHTPNEGRSLPPFGGS